MTDYISEQLLSYCYLGCMGAGLFVLVIFGFIAYENPNAIQYLWMSPLGFALLLAGEIFENLRLTRKLSDANKKN
ncbi:MAG: hypothetical protein WCX22_01890 [Methanoregula sp.]